MAVFDAKIWNDEVFNKYVNDLPRLKQNALLKSGVFRNRGDLKSRLVDQVGGNYITEPIVGTIGGTVQNYDGATNIVANDGIDTYSRGMIVFGRAKAWQERDFSFDITGHDFMEDIASQVGTYWDDVDETTLLSILTGIFGVSTNNFNTDHTLDISALTSNSGADAYVGATTLNDAVQKAAGANKDIFKVAIMHSVVATNLENLQVLQYWKETDANGVQRPVALASWNGRTVLIDDDVPTGTGGTSPNTYTTYTTYLLGDGAFDYCDCGAKVPSEVYRDPTTNGGQDMLITRQRKLFAPKGFSFVQPSPAIISPTDVNLATAARWTPVVDTAGTGYYPSKAMPFARIISKG